MADETIRIEHEWSTAEIIKISNLPSLDCQSALNEFKRAIPFFKEPKDTGSATTENHSLKKQNSAIFLNEIVDPDYFSVSSIGYLVLKIIKSIDEKEFTPNSAMNVMRVFSSISILLSAYRDGDYYLSHRDQSGLTLLLWISDDTEFTGGDLILTDFDYRIKPLKNTAILFPSYYRHEVTPIKSDNKDLIRYTISGFLT